MEEERDRLLEREEKQVAEREERGYCRGRERGDAEVVERDGRLTGYQRERKNRQSNCRGESAVTGNCRRRHGIEADRLLQGKRWELREIAEWGKREGQVIAWGEGAERKVTAGVD